MEKWINSPLNENTLDEKVMHILKCIGVNEKIWELLSSLQWNELSVILIDLFKRRVSDVTAGSILNQMTQTRFCRSSNRNVRKIHLIESEIAKVLSEDWDLLDLSPLDPFWLNSFLTETSQKKIISTSRWFDLLSDGSTKLALEWVIRRKELMKTKEGIRKKVLLWTNIRCLRAQSYDGMDSKDSYAHFKVFASAILWRDIERRDFEYYAIDKTLRFFLELLRKLKKEGIINLESLNINLSDMRITEKLFASVLNIHEDVSDSKELKKQFGNFRNLQIHELMKKKPQTSVFEYLWLSSPSIVKSEKELDIEFGRTYGFEENLIFLSKIYQNVVWYEEEFSELWVKFQFDLGRSAGLWHYSHLAIKGIVEGNHQLKYGLFDGGSANWSAKLTWDRKEKIFVAGLWTGSMANFM